MASNLVLSLKKAIAPVPSGRGGWWPIVRESFGGAWQRNIEIRRDSVLSQFAVFSCQTLIASDIAKLPIKLVSKSGDGIWTETTSSAYSPVLRKPNHFQTRIQFIESWVLSKLTSGNTYVLKARDNRNVVTALYVLDPCLVRPLVSDAGEIFYQLEADNIAGVSQSIIVPAREIIHDRYNTFFHPLCGISPIFANGLTATQGLNIQSMVTKLYESGAMPPGILTAPGAISDETAARLKSKWETEYFGDNTKKIAVLGDGLKFERMSLTSVEGQVIEQLKWTAEVVCSTYHVPPYKIGIGAMPTYDNIQSLNVEYYAQALQRLIEDIEAGLDEGLALDTARMGTEFDLDGLLRMDSVTQMEVLERSKGKLTVNEQRRKLNMPPVEGGDTVYLQEQDHSLQWLAWRDSQMETGPAPEPDDGNGSDGDGDLNTERLAAAVATKFLERVANA